MQRLSPSNSGRAVAAGGAVLRAALALLSLHLLAGPGAAQWSKDPLTNYVMNRATGVKSIGDYAAEGIAAAGQLTAIKVRLGGDLAAARHAFWREYPNGAGLAEAAARIAQLLKDQKRLLLDGLLATLQPDYGRHQRAHRRRCRRRHPHRRPLVVADPPGLDPLQRGGLLDGRPFDAA